MSKANSSLTEQFWHAVLHAKKPEFDSWFDFILETRRYFERLLDDATQQTESMLYFGYVGACYCLVKAFPELFVERQETHPRSYLRGVSLEDLYREISIYR